jgi:transcriptional regulator with XRE-family HTH domain
MEAKELREESAAPRRKEHFATAQKPFHFVDSGLDNVYLVGIKYFEDERGNKVAEIPALEQLMGLIARDIVLASRDLTGKEVKFLRKRLGKKATEFCTYLGLEPETLSRIERETQTASQQVQKLSRLAYCLLSEDHALLDCAKSILQEFVNALAARKKIVLEMNDNQEWRELNAAA